jgi:NAD(P)-dependent dehydrogenase (short-subunit alcohol dehydrogenase family)
MIRLDGKKALITGGSRGIGRATAILFAKAGAGVAINYVRREPAAIKVKEEIEGLGQECVTWQADIAQKKEVERMVENLRARR